MNDDEGTTYLHDECITYIILRTLKGWRCSPRCPWDRDGGDGGAPTNDKGPGVLG